MSSTGIKQSKVCTFSIIFNWWFNDRKWLNYISVNKLWDICYEIVNLNYCDVFSLRNSNRFKVAFVEDKYVISSKNLLRIHNTLYSYPAILIFICRFG